MATTIWPMSVGPLDLRDPDPADIEALLAFRNDPAVNRHMLRTYVDPDVFRREWLAVPGSATDYSCIAHLEGSVAAMGFLDVVDGVGQPGMPQGSEAVIGYIVDPRYWGRGVGSSVARGLLTAAFDRLGLRRVTASCSSDNTASVRILRGLGMRRERHGVASSWRADEGWVDEYQYALLDHEWRALN